ncbi:MAG: type-F conjugative transfer system pilin assembly protein TrbC [Pseudomonadota bacterium]
MSATKFQLSIKLLPRLALLATLGMAGTASALDPVGTHRIERLPQPLSITGTDLAQVARGYEAAGIGAAPVMNGTRLIVFISLAMPEGALRRLIADGARSGAVLVLRGLEGGSLVKTAARIRQLSGGRQGAIQIDPQAFSRFGIQQVPVVVLAREPGVARGCQDASCVSDASFVSVGGDVSLAYALEYVERSAPRFRADAARLRAQVEP